MRLQRFCLLASAGTLVAASGCTGWRSRGGAEGTPVPAGLHGDLRITRNDNSVVILNSATVVNDSIVGFAEHTNARIAIATSDVRMVERREISTVKTAGLTIGTVVLISALTLALAIALLLASWPSP